MPVPATTVTVKQHQCSWPRSSRFHTIGRCSKPCREALHWCPLIAGSAEFGAHPRRKELRGWRHRIWPEALLRTTGILQRLERDVDRTVVAEPFEVRLHL